MKKRLVLSISLLLGGPGLIGMKWDQQEWTPSKLVSSDERLMKAAQNSGDPEEAKLAIEQGATKLFEALSAATCFGHLEVVKVLMENNVTGGSLALEMARGRRHQHIVVYLSQKLAENSQSK